jgi:hypothetical protein
MDRLPARHTRAFILRIWAEYLDQTPPTWRGEIEDVSTRDVLRFRSQEELLACVQRCVEKPTEEGESCSDHVS